MQPDKRQQMIGSEQHKYRIFGLPVLSELELPEVYETHADDAPADAGETVVISRGTIEDKLPSSIKLSDWLEANETQCLYRIDRLCRILVSAGRSIIVDAEVGAAESDVRAYLFSSAFGTIAHQRKLLPLHISAVQTPIGPIAFTGPSGGGKSTIAAALERLNDWPIICDDMAMIYPQDLKMTLHVGCRRTKLWKEAIDQLGLRDRQMAKDLLRHDKFHLEMPESARANFPTFRFLFQLDWTDTLSIVPLSPAHTFSLVMNSIYRPHLARLFGNLESLAVTSTTLAGRINGFRLSRPRAFAGLAPTANALKEFIAKAHV